ncbi:MAG: hypothetical protein K0Q57_775 [Gammaproteobacteria bacterium]|jgi:opacity protein-like surface antigen|nr:hypothetical protein [Gammaproteobacteria bacterium]
MRISLLAFAMSVALSPVFALADNSQATVPSTTSSQLNNAMASNPELGSYQSSSLNPPALPQYQDASQVTAQQNAAINQAVNQVTNVGDGLSVGVQAGFSQGVARSNLNISAKDVQTRSVEGPITGVNAIYGHSFANQFYLGAEAYFNYENSWQDYANAQVASWDTQTKIGNNFGFDILPGYHLDPNSLLFAKLGINYANLSIDNYNNVHSPNPYNATSPGVDLGLGFRHSLTQNLSLALEYDWIYYYSAMNHYTYGYPSSNIFSQNLFMLSLDYQLDQIGQNSSSRPSLQLTGPYAGANFGMKAQRLQVNNSIQPTEWSSDGIAERLKLGYNYQVNSWFDIGTEAFTEFTQGIGAQLLGTTINKEGTGYGLSILPGYIMDPSDLLFTRLGLVRTNFEGLQHMSPTYSESTLGYQFGIGFETALTQALSLVIEYDYTAYKAITVPNSANSYSYFDNLFSLGLNYHF